MHTGQYSYYIDVTYETRETLGGLELNEAFVVRSSPADAVYLYGQPVANNTKPAMIQTVQQFISHIAEQMPARSLFRNHDIPAVVVNMAFTPTEGILHSLSEILYNSELSDRIAVICPDRWTTALVSTFQPRYMAFLSPSLSQPVAELIEHAHPAAVPVIFFSIDAVTLTNSRDVVSSLREEFPRAKVMARIVDTREQLMWCLDQGVDGVVSNDPVSVRRMMVEWYQEACSTSTMLLNGVKKVV